MTISNFFTIIGIFCAFDKAYEWGMFWWALAYLFREEEKPQRKEVWPYQVFGRKQ